MTLLQFTNTKVTDLVTKRTDFLKNHPELEELQDKIDTILAKAGKNQLNRCSAIQDLMIEEVKKLNSLNKELIKDISLLEEMKT